MKKSITILILLLTGLASISYAQFVKVTADGISGEADPNVSRQMALTDALRNAVEKGVGQAVTSMSKVQDFQLNYDRVFVRSFGYVRNYTILSAGRGDDGVYRVRIQAEVREGDPDLEDSMAIQMLVRLKKSPRIALMVNETIHGLDRETDYAKSWFEQQAQAMHLPVMDLTRSAYHQNLQAMKDEMFGDEFKAQIRRAGLHKNYDYIIDADVMGEYLGQESVYGSRPFQAFELGMDLRLIKPDTGETAITIPIPGSGGDTSSLRSPTLAARDLIHRKLSGETRESDVNGTTLFTRLLAYWVAELDLGKIVEVELEAVPFEQYEALKADLDKVDQKLIRSIWPGEFSARGLSTFRVETTLDQSLLIEKILESLGAKNYSVSESTAHYLQFVPTRGGMVAPVHVSEALTEGSSRVASATVVDSSESMMPAVSPSPSIVVNQVGKKELSAAAEVSTNHSGTAPPWVWAVAGGGCVLVLMGIMMALKNRPHTGRPADLT